MSQQFKVPASSSKSASRKRRSNIDFQSPIKTKYQKHIDEFKTFVDKLPTYASTPCYTENEDTSSDESDVEIEIDKEVSSRNNSADYPHIFTQYPASEGSRSQTGNQFIIGCVSGENVNFVSNGEVVFIHDLGSLSNGGFLRDDAVLTFQNSLRTKKVKCLIFSDSDLDCCNLSKPILYNKDGSPFIEDLECVILPGNPDEYIKKKKIMPRLLAQLLMDFPKMQLYCTRYAKPITDRPQLQEVLNKIDPSSSDDQKFSHYCKILQLLVDIFHNISTSQARMLDIDDFIPEYIHNGVEYIFTQTKEKYEPPFKQYLCHKSVEVILPMVNIGCGKRDGIYRCGNIGSNEEVLIARIVCEVPRQEDSSVCETPPKSPETYEKGDASGSKPLPAHIDVSNPIVESSSKNNVPLSPDKTPDSSCTKPRYFSASFLGDIKLKCLNSALNAGAYLKSSHINMMHNCSHHKDYCPDDGELERFQARSFSCPHLSKYNYPRSRLVNRLAKISSVYSASSQHHVKYFCRNSKVNKFGVRKFIGRKVLCRSLQKIKPLVFTLQKPLFITIRHDKVVYEQQQL